MKHMKNNKMSFKTLAFLGIGLILSFSACTDLEEELYSEIRTEDFSGSDATIISDALAPFTEFGKGWNWGIWGLSELPADSYAWTQKGRHGYDNGDWQRLHWHSWTNKEWLIDNTWNMNYRVIGFCNDFLKKYADVKQEDMLLADIDELRATVRGLRAYHYYILIDNYRRVPLVKVDNMDEGQPLPVDPAQIIEFIEGEIADILPDLPEKSDITGYGSFTKGAAHMLLAKLYLNCEVWTGLARWEDCLEALNNIPVEYQLATSWQEPFLVNNKDCSENIFVIPFEENKLEGFRLHRAVLHYNHQYSLGVRFGTWNGIVTQPDHYRSFHKDDMRLNQFLVGPQYYPDGSPVLGTEEAKGQPLVLTVDVKSMAESREDEGARNLKYPVRQGEMEMNNDWVIFRKSDAELMKAECYLRLGQATEALKYINPIRERAFGNASHNYTEATLTLDELLAERGRELSFEGYRRQDLVRFGKFGDAWWDKEQTDNDAIFPYPFDAVSANPNLK